MEDNNYIKVKAGCSSCVFISVVQKPELETLNVQTLIKAERMMILRDGCDKPDFLKGSDTFLPWFRFDPVQSWFLAVWQDFSLVRGCSENMRKHETHEFISSVCAPTVWGRSLVCPHAIKNQQLRLISRSPSQQPLSNQLATSWGVHVFPSQTVIMWGTFINMVKQCLLKQVRLKFASVMFQLCNYTFITPFLLLVSIKDTAIVMR